MRSATELSISAFGVVVSIAGMEHGVGAVLQGNVPPDGLFIESWPNSPAYEILSGEPAMTLVPNLLISGILTILVSIILALWSVRFVGSLRGGLGLIGISVTLLLVGGGLSPPIIGVFLGVTAIWRSSRPNRVPRFLAKERMVMLAGLWRSLLVVGLVSWFSLWPGVPLLYYLFGIADASIVIVLVLLSVTLLVSTLVAAVAYDSVYPTG